MPNTATKDQVQRDLDAMSVRIGALVRASAVGILAVGWGFIVTPNTRLQVGLSFVLLAISLAFLALLLDWAQYLVGYLNSDRTWRAMESDGELRGWTPDWLYRSRERIFYAKQAATVAGVVVLVAAMLPAIARLAGH
jgi:hypothetical protein